MLNNNPILVVGAGSWGTALALVLARNQNLTYLWDNDPQHVRNLSTQACNNRHLPGYAFPPNLSVSVDLAASLQQVEDIVIAAPCEGLLDILDEICRSTARNLKICLVCKGLEPRTQSLNHQVVLDKLGDIPVAVLSGPSFAAEVAAGLPTAVTVAAENDDVARYFSARFHSDVFRVYTQNDIVGVQIGGAVKNVMAIAAGIADGLGFGANTRAALITRGLVEITRLGIAMGGRQETFMGLAGLGDLVLTCTDNQSRNRRLGLALAAGKSLNEACQEIGQVVEGVKTAEVVPSLAQKYKIEMPISEQIIKVIHGELTPAEAVQALLAREAKSE
ncbi:MAG: NAD(P)-dependent glycerol-3-phosphate dehydrogenase [Proteobacteria bacterium]|nr:NAD(P)-dependent glycerol-3-phosphate dehydrogenase [Pseudomonadota bacterium]